MRITTKVALIALTFMTWARLEPTSVQAAKIELINSSCLLNGECKGSIQDAILVSGPIEKGDFIKFEKVVATAPVVASTLFLRSPGGSADLAMKIGRLAREMLFDVQAPKLDHEVTETGQYAGGDYPICIENGVLGYPGYAPLRGQPCVCASACFLIYVAGAWRNEGYVGIHRVYIRPEQNAQLSLKQSTQIMQSYRDPIIKYLTEMGVPSRYADIMFSTSSRDIYVPTAPEIKKDFFGYPPEIMEWLMARCGVSTEKEADEAFWRDMQTGKGPAALAEKKKRDDCIDTAMWEERIKRRLKFRKDYLEWADLGERIE